MNRAALFISIVLISAKTIVINAAELGVFSDHEDVGKPTKIGDAKFDSAKGEYLVTGGGSNMWFASDAFHFVWKKVSGDVSLAAKIDWIGAAGNEHRKACLIIRQSLDANSAYADAVLHGNGLTALQCRDAAGGVTREIISGTNAPQSLRIERRGDYVAMSVAKAGEELHPGGGTYLLKLTEPFYIGLAVSAHDDKTNETAAFSNVKIDATPLPADAKPILASTLEVIAVSSGDRRVVYYTRDHIEAPNWSRDGKYFVFNRGGRICKMPTVGGTPELVDTGSSIKCNNDHGISPDGTMLAISDQSYPDNKSRVLIVPIGGGTPRKLTENGPSYWHGWSPDGTTLAFCGERNGEFDVYTIPVAGGEEKRLTTAKGLDDGPEYSPDGKFIYWNSERTGRMQLYRMKPDGSEQEQLTNDEYNNWFAHPSPDGKQILFLSYGADVTGHPGNKDVLLRVMPTGGGQIKTLAKIFGGQGTINVPSWSPDSREAAFVSYQFVYP